MKDQTIENPASPITAVNTLRRRLERVTLVLYLIAAVALLGIMFSPRAPASQTPTTTATAAAIAPAAAPDLTVPAPIDASLTTRDITPRVRRNVVSE